MDNGSVKSIKRIVIIKGSNEISAADAIYRLIKTYLDLEKMKGDRHAL